MTFIPPIHRSRRLRLNQQIRDLVAQNRINLNDIVYPMFIMDGANQTTSIDALVGIKRYSVDLLVKKISELYGQGIKGFALFPYTPNDKKDDSGTESCNESNLVNTAMRAIKKSVPDCVLFADVALDPYTSHGHDGVTDGSGYVLNDKTVQILMKQAVVQAQSGADVICPSDMMDGRIGNIRNALDDAGFENVSIMSYAAKYASNFYGPFRQAIGSTGTLKGDKKTYQMDMANSTEALKEVGRHIDEGADIVMIKPGMPYLDVVKSVKDTFGLPTFVYQVSGEYAMIKGMIQAGHMHEDAILESIIAFKRAGADCIFTYFAEDIIALLKI